MRLLPHDARSANSNSLKEGHPDVMVWLESQAGLDLHLVRRLVHQSLMEAGISDKVAEAVALVPRHPFVASECWRLAHVLEMDHARLPSPLRFARLLDGLAIKEGEHLVVAEERVSWTTAVSGVLASKIGARVATTAPLISDKFALCLEKLGVDVGVQLDSGNSSIDAIVVVQPCSRPSPNLFTCLRENGRAVWSTYGLSGPDRIYRVQRRRSRLRLTNLGLTHEFSERKV
jgi:protein-L-isoaspartate O-methyltransferase